MSDIDLYDASERGDLTEVKRLLDSGADVNLESIVWDILYNTVMCTAVIDIIIIIYCRMDIHLLWLPVGMVMSVYVTFSSTGELM